MSLREVFSKIKYSMRFSILSVFITLFVTSIIILTLIIFFRFAQSISNVALQFMEQTSLELYDRLQTEVNDISVEMDMFNRLVKNGIVDVRNEKELIDYISILLDIESRLIPSLQGIYFADETGSFFMARRSPDGGMLNEIINRREGAKRHIFIYYDKSGKMINQIPSTDESYDPRVRPWYIAAKSKKKFAWTDVYPYHLTGNLGITAAKPIYADTGELKGIIAFNLRLDYIRRFIEKMKVSANGIVYIVTLAGKVIALPHLPQYQAGRLINISDVNIPWLVASFEEYKKHSRHQFKFDYDEKTYLAVYRPFPQLGPSKGWRIGMVAPERDFIEELLKTNFVALLSSLGILLAGIYLMSKLVNKIVKPLKGVVQETEKIRHFVLDDVPPIQSRIAEIDTLSRAVYRMKQGLRSFKKYVPANLVRQLIESGRDVIIGGEKKQIAIFFSDIENFTSISEEMEPDQLMEYICEYFNEISLIVDKEQGTIDKYIGDSVMAFWGAPLPEENSCELAANAALSCVERIKELNKQWKVQGKLPLHTRIGLHFGEAIVGNLGSTERLNYTALGDAINVTSRLENINKYYHTQIMVSDAFYKKIKNDFALRFVDSIALKGKIHGIYIYELLAKTKEELSFNLSEYQKIFLKGFQAYQRKKWDDAIALFQSCLNVYPKDTVSPMFIARCLHFKENPPDLDWNGIWRMQEK